MARADLPSVRAAREADSTKYASDDALSAHLSHTFARLQVHNPAITWLSVCCPLGDEYNENTVCILETRLHDALGSVELSVPILLSVLHDGAFPLAYQLTSWCDEAIDALAQGDVS